MMDPRSALGLFSVIILVGISSPARAALGDNCASDEGPMCMANLQSLQMKDGGDVTKLSVTDLVQRCSDLRKNIACLLTHLQRCVQLEKRDQHAKVIMEARKYLAATCEADESVKAHWKENKCYRQATLQRCDREFHELMQHKPPNYPPTDNQCRNFYQYRSCVQRTVASCSDDSEEFVTLYLLDYGARLVWLCPAIGEEQKNNQANNVLPGNLPPDPLAPQGPGGSQQGSSNSKNSGTTRKTMADIRRIPVIRDTHFVPPHKIEVSLNNLIRGIPSRFDDPSLKMSHDNSHVDISNPSRTRNMQVATGSALGDDDDADDDADGIAMWLNLVKSRRARDVIDEAGSDHLDSEFLDFPADPGSHSDKSEISDSESDKAAISGSSGSTCVKLIQQDMRRCLNRYQRLELEPKKQQSRNKSTTVASDAQQLEKKPKICCGFATYTHCLQSAVQIRCSQDREALVDTVIAQTSKLIGMHHCDDYYYGSPKCPSGAALLYTMPSTCLVLLLAVTLRYLAVRCALL